MTLNDKRIFTASAPGRLDVMGGIADYSGSLVLQITIQAHTQVQIILRNDYHCTFKSTTDSGETLTADVNYNTLLNKQSVDYSYALKVLKERPVDHWIAYIIGCALVLQKEKGIAFTGADFVIESNVPLGKGVSSSASIEVATMKAMAEAFDVQLSGTELPRLAQRVENLIVGAPCGLMDQLASYFGEPDKLLPIVCQPDKIEATIAIPKGIKFIGIDSGVRHSVSGASYTDVRCAAFMGYSIIAQTLGVPAAALQKAKETNDFSELPYQGFLCNIPVEKFEKNFLAALPQQISGEVFIKKYKLSTDSVTEINPEKNYAVRQCALHPVYEQSRVLNFRQHLLALHDSSSQEKITHLQKLGELMYQSHQSYSQCGLGSDGTDEIVNLSRGRRGIYGAKITGGGNGGTVCMLVDDDGLAEANQIHLQLCEKQNTELAFFV